MKCSKCGSQNILAQPFQENSSETITKTKEAGHGIIWWLFIGWWWKPIKLCLWILCFPIMAVLHIGRKKKNISTSKTVNKIQYKTVCTCQECGHSWYK